jgi:hypothetical protein
MWDLELKASLSRQDFSGLSMPKGNRFDKVLCRSNRLCVERNGYESKRASYAREGFSAPNPVRVGCKFC